MNGRQQPQPSIADVLTFDGWTEEQKRIARAGTEVERIMAAHIRDARSEGFDAGKAAAEAELNREERKAADKYEDLLASVWVKLKMLAPSFTPGDTRRETIIECIAIVAAGSNIPRETVT